MPSRKKAVRKVPELPRRATAAEVRDYYSSAKRRGQPPNKVRGSSDPDLIPNPPFMNRSLIGSSRPKPYIPNETWYTRWQPKHTRDPRRAGLRIRVSDIELPAAFCGQRLSVLLIARFRDKLRTTAFLAPPQVLADAHEFTFNYSAIVMFLRRFPVQIGVSVEFYTQSPRELKNPGAKPTPVFREEVCIFNERTGLKDFRCRQFDKVRGLYKVDRDGFLGYTGADTENVEETSACGSGAAVGNAGESAGANRSVGAKKCAGRITVGANRSSGAGGSGDAMDIVKKVPVAVSKSKTLVPSKKARRRERARRENGPPDGSIRLEIRGEKVWESQFGPVGGAQAQVEDEHVQVNLSFQSISLPWWEGVVLHDFFCPWCRTDFRRLRALLVHFQGDHNPQAHVKFMDTLVDLPENAKTKVARPIREGRFPVRLHVDVLNSSPHRTRRTSEPLPPQLTVDVAPPSPAPLAPAVVEELAQLDESGGSASGDGCDARSRRRQSGRLRGDAVVGKDNELNLTIAPAECRNCSRVFAPKADEDGNVDPRWCGRWCLVRYQKKVLEEASARDGDDGSSADESEGEETMAFVKKSRKKCSPRRARRIRAREPMHLLAPQKKKATIDFDETFGRRPLYHLSSFARVKKAHFDENDDDSEDEVDHRWTLDVSDDYMKHLDVPAKHRVLWSMWNKFAFEKGNPGHFGNQYTLHGLEMFVLEYKHEINRLGLRLPLVAFLKAQHTHGNIDANGFLDVLLVLDGKRKHRDCLKSRQPMPISELGIADVTGESVLAENKRLTGELAAEDESD